MDTLAAPASQDRPVVNVLVRAALAGVATGARSFTGLAALTLATPAASAASARQPDRCLRRPWVKGLVTLAAVQELVMDKLPQAPSRLGVIGLGGRVTTAAAVGTVAAQRGPGPAAVKPETPGTHTQSAAAELAATSGPAPSGAVVVAAVTTAVSAAVGAAWLGAAWRKVAAERFGTDYAGAGIEDVVAMSLAWLATRV
jgi:uncharacterized membrane protein